MVRKNLALKILAGLSKPLEGRVRYTGVIGNIANPNFSTLVMTARLKMTPISSITLSCSIKFMMNTSQSHCWP